jgi:hypothetical protein
MWRQGQLGTRATNLSTSARAALFSDWMNFWNCSVRATKSVSQFTCGGPKLRSSVSPSHPWRAEADKGGTLTSTMQAAVHLAFIIAKMAPSLVFRSLTLNVRASPLWVASCWSQAMAASKSPGNLRAASRHLLNGMPDACTHHSVTRISRELHLSHVWGWWWTQRRGDDG